mgnify:CR=1 FL=1
MSDQNKTIVIAEHDFANFLKDKHAVVNSRSAKTGGIAGKVIMRNEKGEVILEKDNLIVLRGRTFALEKLFETAIVGSTYVQNIDRKIALFKVGTGGTPPAAPFDPYVPQYTDMDLSAPVPFLIVDPTKISGGDPEKISNPSIVVELTPEQQLKYYLPEVDPAFPEQTKMMGKKFETEEWVYSLATNEVYRKLTLLISEIDCRKQYLNELGLMIAGYDSVNNAYGQVEAFSRICFDTESCTNLTKTITVEYLIYA